MTWLAFCIFLSNKNEKLQIWSRSGLSFKQFRKNHVKSTGDIKGFGILRYEDQSKIKEKISSGGVANTGTGFFI